MTVRRHERNKEREEETQTEPKIDTRRHKETQSARVRILSCRRLMEELFVIAVRQKDSLLSSSRRNVLYDLRPTKNLQGGAFQLTPPVCLTFTL